MLLDLLLLITGHFVADYPLQGDAVATGKNKNLEYAKFGVPWYYWMAGHAATHSMVVALVTQNFFAGLFEFVAHFIIDWLKCSRMINLHVDQLLHIICKLIIVGVMYYV